MARIDYSISVTAVGSGTVEGQTVEKIDSDLNRSLSCAKSDSTWAGNSVTGWSSGTHTHISSNGSTGTDITIDNTSGGADGLWIKHTGFKFDSGLSTTSETTSKVIVLAAGGSVEICNLTSGQAVFFPDPKNGTWKIKDDTGGEVVAVEYAVLT